MCFPDFQVSVDKSRADRFSPLTNLGQNKLWNSNTFPSDGRLFGNQLLTIILVFSSWIISSTQNNYKWLIICLWTQSSIYTKRGHQWRGLTSFVCSTESLITWSHSHVSFTNFIDMTAFPLKSWKKNQCI